MFWGIATLVLFLLYVTAKGELPTYIGFFKPQANTSDNTPDYLPSTPAPVPPVGSGLMPSPLNGVPGAAPYLPMGGPYP